MLSQSRIGSGGKAPGLLGAIRQENWTFHTELRTGLEQAGAQQNTNQHPGNQWRCMYAWMQDRRQSAAAYSDGTLPSIRVFNKKKYTSGTCRSLSD